MEWQATFALIGSIGAIASVAGACFVFWRSGGNGANAAAIASYKSLHEGDTERLKQLELRVTTCEKLHRDNLEASGRLQGELAATTKILQGRNPEMDTFMKTSMAHIESAQKFMSNFAELPSVMNELKTFIGSINEKMRKEA